MTASISTLQRQRRIGQADQAVGDHIVLLDGQRSAERLILQAHTPAQTYEIFGVHAAHRIAGAVRKIERFGYDVERRRSTRFETVGDGARRAAAGAGHHPRRRRTGVEFHPDGLRRQAYGHVAQIIDWVSKEAFRKAGNVKNRRVAKFPTTDQSAVTFLY
uniref:Uncharacterized protein n=1 Tax=Romanomermis culicivorax TaxID=13658 RepID=A0A915KZJ3_ROMCU